MSLDLIREQYKAILSGVDGVGVVHDYQRVTTGDWGKFLNRFRDPDGRINTWMITRDQTSEEYADEFGKNKRRYRFRTRGYYGLEDDKASEIVFQDLVEDICDTFRDEDTINGTVEDTEPMQVELVEPRMFGGVLCNFCELTQWMEERKEFSG